MTVGGCLQECAPYGGCNWPLCQHSQSNQSYVSGFRKDIVLELGGYPNVFLREDYALWVLAIGRGFRLCNLAEPLVLARSGIEMYQRRRGLKSALAEVKLQRLLVAQGVSSVLTALVFGAARFFALLLPGRILGSVYRIFLRGGS